MKVSVWMSAYNHEKYIKKCLDSVLMQKTNFDFEIILGEDCSTDLTREIVIEYQQKNPERFRLFLPQKNIGMMQMDMETWKLCTGQYIALLNGDDFWTDENKLQLQVDYLENNTDVVMCFHRARVINEDNGYIFETEFCDKSNILRIESLLQGYNPVMTPTVMFRNVLKIPEWYSDLPYGDMPVYLLLAQMGKIVHLDRLMSVYRVHKNGQWQGDSVYNNLIKDLKFYKVMNEKLNHKYEGLIRIIFAHRYFDLVINNLNRNNFNQAKRFFKKLLFSDLSFVIEHKKDIINLQQVLYEGANVKKVTELLKKEVKWKVV